MHLFELIPNEGSMVHMEARHEWTLPGVRCDLCRQTWATVGVAYPTIDVPGDGAQRRLRPGVVAWEEYEELQHLVAPLVPPGTPTPPGTGFGPLVGRIRESSTDAAWPHPWMVLWKRPAYDRISAALRNVRGRNARLTSQQSQPDLVEMEIPAYGNLAASQAVTPCGKCGRVGIKRPAQVIVRRGTWPDAIPFFRLTDLTTIILVTEDGLARLSELAISGTRAVEVLQE